MTEQTKTCRYACGETKPATEFGPHKLTPDGLATYCRSCEASRMQLRKHGLTAAQKAEIAAAQGGCAICHRPDPGAKGWVVDHDHTCCPGEVSCEKCRRGILCGWCNKTLGTAFDSADILRAAAAYIESGSRLVTDRYAESVDRAAVPSRVTSPTDVQDVQTHAEPHSPSGDNSPSVTRARAYGFEFRFCEICDTQQPVIDEFDDQIGYEEQARPVRVVALECGHDIVTEVRR